MLEATRITVMVKVLDGGKRTAYHFSRGTECKQKGSYTTTVKVLSGSKRVSHVNSCAAKQVSFISLAIRDREREREQHCHNNGTYWAEAKVLVT
jgi:hypothetical protein